MRYLLSGGDPGQIERAKTRAQGRAVRLRARGARARARHGLAAHRRRVSPRLIALAALAAALALTLTVGASPAGAAPGCWTALLHCDRAKSRAFLLPRGTSEGEGMTVEGGGIQVGPPLPNLAPPAKGGSVGAGKASHPGFFDIPGQIENAINEWFAGLVKDALNPAMVLVGRTLLSTPQIAGEAQVRSYWQLTLGVADSLLVLLVVAAGALVMSHETLQSSDRCRRTSSPGLP